jgi:hypothetical protein
MKTIDDILYIRSQNSNDTDTIMLVLGIDGEIVYILTTHIWFYNLITSYAIEENLNAPEGKFWIDIKDNDVILETIELTEQLSALLRSNPDIIEIARSPLPPIESIGILRWVNVGWTYDSDYNIFPPSWWQQPKPNNVELTEEQKAVLRAKGYDV